MTTTLARIKEHYPCTDSWRKLLKHLGKTEADDEALPYAVILESNGLDDALWACRAEPRYDREWRLYAVWCAEQVSHLMTDPRSHAALQVARRFANSEATRDQLWAAGAAAMAAARTVWDAAWAANMAAKDAALAARDAAWAARAANRPAGDAAGDAAKNGQTAEFLRLVTGGVAQEKGDE
jgi:hypothetical protein